MRKITISIPDQLARRMKTSIPERQRSKVIAALLESEIVRREVALHECALAVENDVGLTSDMAAWSVTVNDGFNDDEMRI